MPGAILALCFAAATALWLYSFTVDDALISIRYARHLAFGEGYRFDVRGPVTDGVTPLAWPYLLYPFAHAAPLVVLARAKAFGLVAWLGVVAVWGAAVGRCEGSAEAKLAALLGLLVCVPLAAHAVSGMETAVATALATMAALQHARPRLAALVAGLAASLRPELCPWAVVLAIAFCARELRLHPPGPPPRNPERGDTPHTPGQGGGSVSLLLAGLLAVAPFAVCCIVRVAVFGSPAPLAVLAKPSDLLHGLSYVAAAGLASVGPVLAFAPFAAAREKGPGRAIVLAGAVHLCAVTIVGGDWMPFARLVAPVVPSLLYASVLLWPHSHAWAARGRATLALLVGLYVLVFAAPKARSIGPDREALVHATTPLLSDRERVASVDIGWVSAATEADIVDLAGVTDPEVAALGGGHTSRRIGGAFLLAENPDALLLYAEASDVPLDRWSEAPFPRVVEARLAHDPLVEAHFEPIAFVPLGRTGNGYYVLYAR